MFEITRVRGIEGLEAIRATWEVLYGASLNPSFYSYWYWYESISRHLLDSEIDYFLCTDRSPPGQVERAQSRSISAKNSM